MATLYTQQDSNVRKTRFLISVFLIIIIGLGFASSAFAASVSQSGGATWETGERVTISWSSGLTNPASISVYLQNEDTQRYHQLYYGSDSNSDPLLVYLQNEDIKLYGGSFVYEVGDNDIYDEYILLGRYRVLVRVIKADRIEIAESGIFTIVAGGDCVVSQSVLPADGGVLTPPTGTRIETGRSLSASATAKPGYVISYFIIDDVNQTTAAGQTDYTSTVRCPPTAKPLALTASFTPAQRSTIFSSTDSGATITPLGLQYIYPSERKSYYIRAKTNPDFEIYKLRVNGVDQLIDPPKTSLARTLSFRVEPQTIQVFSQPKPDEWTIVASVENPEGGTITPSGTIKLPITTQKQGFSIRPTSAEWVIESVKIDGVAQPIKTYYEIFYNPDQDRRTIQVKFQLACLAVTPKQTLENLRNNQQTYINLSSFRDWVAKNKSAVQQELIEIQECYLLEPDSDATSGGGSSVMRQTIRDDIRPLLSVNKPAIGAWLFGKKDYSGDDPEVAVFGAHGVIVTSFKLKVSANPPRTVYEIKVLDPNGPREITLNCEDQVNLGGRSIFCPIPSYLASDFPEAEDIYLVSIGPTKRRNAMLLSLDSVRVSPIDWINKNYTLIENFSVPGPAKDGVCLGWSEFNAKASILVKECPFDDRTVFDKDQGQGVLPEEIAGSVSAPNLLINGDFSNGVNNWIAQGIAQKAVGSSHGTLVITNDGSNSPNYYLRHQTVTVKPGTTYEYGGEIKANLGSTIGSDNFCQIDFYLPNHLDTDDISVRRTTSGWQSFDQRVTVPANAPPTAQLRLLTGSALNGTCAYDNVYLREVAGEVSPTSVLGRLNTASSRVLDLLRSFWSRFAF
ncbi:MAG: carbohydrate binding domain-containing protein [Candidatus Paceibacterota bacterium]